MSNKYVFHQSGQMSDLMEENGKKSCPPQEPSSEKSLSPAKDSSISHKKLVWLLLYYFIIKILTIALDYFSHYKNKELKLRGKHQ